ncbi:MAG: GtrA family protein [Defluviitaleaceae bacterium]|nr:GtrA family protein [Defluviitaleaceae bacterium]
MIAKFKKYDIQQFIRYSAVGFINTGVYYALYLLFLWLGLNFGLAHTIATAIAIFNSYLWNKFFTFKRKGQAYTQLAKFLGVCFVQYLVNLFIIYVCVNFIGLSEEISGLVPIPFSLLVGYVGNRFFSFRQ